MTSKDRQAKQFIEKAHQQQSAQPYSTTLRIPPDLLKRVDAAAAKLHITRSAWIKLKLSQILDDEDDNAS